MRIDTFFDADRCVPRKPSMEWQAHLIRCHQFHKKTSIGEVPRNEASTKDVEAQRAEAVRL